MNSDLRNARINTAFLLFLSSVGLMAGLIALLAYTPGTQAPAGVEPLTVYCAAGLKMPVDEIARQYQQEFGVPIRLQYGARTRLWPTSKSATWATCTCRPTTATSKWPAARICWTRSFPFARMQAVLAVAKGNPKQIDSLDDLHRRRDPVCPGQPGRGGHRQAHARGVDRQRPLGRDQSTHQGLQGDGERRGQRREGRHRRCRLRVGRHGRADAAGAGSGAPAGAEGRRGRRRSWACSSRSQQPTAALRFARYLAARDKGLAIFRKHGFQVVEGDAWAVEPQLKLFAGAMLRTAVDETITAFEEREGVKVTRVYNGCGILVAQMRDGRRAGRLLRLRQAVHETGPRPVPRFVRRLHQPARDPGAQGQPARDPVAEGPGQAGAEARHRARAAVRVGRDHAGDPASRATCRAR